MHRFDQDISLEQKGPLTHVGEVSPHWSINSVANGGYVIAMIATAMLEHSENQATPIITANYLYKCEMGDVRIDIEKMSESRQFERLEARLVQDGRERVRAMGTFRSEEPDCKVRRYESRVPDIAAREDCVAIPRMPNYTLYDHMDVLLDPSCSGWMSGGELSEKSEMSGWINFKEDRPHDLYSVALCADSFPPAVLASQGMVAWVPTIELSVSIRNIPETRWLKAVFRTRYIDCGILEEDGEVWDENDRLCAVSRQIAQFRV
ncbi:MAG: thioesterase family protein [Desulfatibacillaceae bacterium]